MVFGGITAHNQNTITVFEIDPSDSSSHRVRTTLPEPQQLRCVRYEPGVRYRLDRVIAEMFDTASTLHYP